MPNPPNYWKVNPSDAPILIIAAWSDSLPMTVVNDYADNVLSQQLSQVVRRVGGLSSADSRSPRCGCRSIRRGSPRWG